MSNRGLCLAVLLTVACAQTKAALAAYAGDYYQANECLGSVVPCVGPPPWACGTTSPSAQEVISALAADTTALSTTICESLVLTGRPRSWAAGQQAGLGCPTGVNALTLPSTAETEELSQQGPDGSLVYKPYVFAKAAPVSTCY